MAFEKLKEALLRVIPNVGHYHAYEKGEQYIVWAEDGAGRALSGDNRCLVQVLTGAVHYFTRQEADPHVARIQSALTEAEIAWQLNSIQQEQDTGYTHYTWRWEMV